MITSAPQASIQTPKPTQVGSSSIASKAKALASSFFSKDKKPTPSATLASFMPKRPFQYLGLEENVCLYVCTFLDTDDKARLHRALFKGIGHEEGLLSGIKELIAGDFGRCRDDKMLPDEYIKSFIATMKKLPQINKKLKVILRAVPFGLYGVKKEFMLWRTLVLYRGYDTAKIINLFKIFSSVQSINQFVKPGSIDEQSLEILNLLSKYLIRFSPQPEKIPQISEDEALLRQNTFCIVCSMGKLSLAALLSAHGATNSRASVLISSEERLVINGITIAALYGHVDIVQFFVSKNKSLVSSNISKNKETPLYSASYNGHVEICEFLLDNNADPDQATGWGLSTPLIIASLRGHASVVRLLLERNAQVNTRTPNGKTALHYAINVPVCVALLEYGADPEIEDFEHQTPLFEAGKRKDLQMHNLLMNALEEKIRKELADEKKS